MSRGGKRPNSGRRRLSDKQSRAATLIAGLKKLYRTDCDEEAKMQLIIELAGTQRGRLFIAEHLFGKPTQQVEQTTTTATASVLKLTTEEIELIKDE